MTRTRLTLSLLLSTWTPLAGCGDDDGGGGGGSGDRSDFDEQTGALCEVADDCYPDVESSELSGPAQCLDRVRDGYCTHECGDDSDCCAAEGECESDLPQVCSPFESTGQMLCFLSCEAGDIRAPEDDPDAPNDEQSFCQREASPDFICRSSGGGSANRKVCVPGDCGVGAGCDEEADCDADLDCLTGFEGGYCGIADCSGDADCPTGSVCVADGDDTHCLRTCEAQPDCSFCRHPDYAATCSDEVDLVEASGVSVCVPDRR